MTFLRALRMPQRLVARVALVACCASGCGGLVEPDATSGSRSSTAAGPSPGSDGASSNASRLAELDGQVSSMTADATTLYVGMTDGRVLTIPKSGGNPTTLAGQGTAGYPEGLAVDDTWVYVTSLGQRNVSRIAKADGHYQVVAEDLDRPYQLAIDETHVYVVDQGEGGNDGRVLRVPKEGGAIEVLAPGQQQPNAISIDDTNVYFANGPYGDVNGSIRMVPKAGGDVKVLARRLEGVDRIVVQGDKVWMVDVISHSLAYASVGGSDLTPTHGAPVDGWGLGSDGTAWFGTTYDHPSLTATMRSFDPSGAGTATLATWSYGNDYNGLVAAVATVVDATHVYWVDETSSSRSGAHGTIRVARRP